MAIRRTRRSATVASGLVLGLALTGVAGANPALADDRADDAYSVSSSSDPGPSRHSGPSRPSRPGDRPAPSGPAAGQDADAVRALRTAIDSARSAFLDAVRPAMSDYRSADTAAKAELRTALAAATTKADRMAAVEAYRASLVGPRATLQGAMDAARETYWGSVDAALAAFDAATASTEVAAARQVFRDAVHDAVTAYVAASRTASEAHRSAATAARATLIDALRAAPDQAAQEQAWAAYRDTVDGLDDTLRTAMRAARDAFRTSLRAARDALQAATGTSSAMTPPLGKGWLGLPDPSGRGHGRVLAGVR